jgi:type I restriction enzyme, S subunit
MFIFYAIKFHKNRLLRLAYGTTFLEISKNHIRNVRFPCPQISEQHKIAAILSKVDELIQKTEVLEQAQRLKKGLMQKLLTKGIRNIKSLTPILDTEYVKLKHHVEIKGRIGWRGLKKEEYTKAGPFMISGNNLIDGKIMWDSSIHISQFRFEESPEIELKLNDIVMIKDGISIGRLGFIDYLPGSSTISSTLVLIREVSGIFYPKFLYYYFQGPFIQQVIKEKVSGLAIPHIFQHDIKELKVPKLPGDEQHKIA